MKPIVSAILGTIAYAAANVLLEQKLSKYNNMTVIICYSAFTVAVFIPLRLMLRTSDPSFNFPVGAAIIPMFVLGILYALGDYFYIGAYTNGADLMTVVNISVMFPIFATLIKYAWTRNLAFNPWQAAGCILAIVAVICVARGSPAPSP